MAKSQVPTCLSWATNTSYGQSNTGLRGIATAISDILTEGGWVQTSDTGQTASGSLTTVNTSGNLRGYQIWRMNDPLQATAPVFMRLEYLMGVISYAGNYVGYQLAIQVGDGSDGAGNLTNSSPKRYVYSGGPSAGSASSFFCATPSTFKVCLNPMSASYEVFMSIERIRNSNNEDLSTGVSIVTVGQPGYGSVGSGISSYLHYFAGSSRVINSQLLTFVPAGTTSLASNANVQLLGILNYNLDGNEIIGDTVLYFSADLSPFNPLNVFNNGVQKTYMPLYFTMANGLAVAIGWE